MNEKELLRKSGIRTGFILLFISLFWFFYSTQVSYGGYSGGPASGIVGGINSRITTQANWEVGSSGVFVIRLGIENVTGLGTATGYMTGTNTYYPRIEWTPVLGTFNFIGTGSYPVTIQTNGVAIPSAGSVSGKMDIVGGTGTTNVFTNTTLAGIGTITASFGANGLVISPAELSMVDGSTIPLNTATGSITNHAHTGSDGTTKIAHDNVTGTGANSHPIIDTFIASKASASGLASLDANSLVVQNPASGTSTPGIAKIPISLGTGFLNDSWLSAVISKLGQDIQLGTETTGNTDNITEGGTNKYYTDVRVNSAVGSLSVNSLSDVNIIFNENDFVKIVGGQLVSGSSTATVAFSDVTGSITSGQLPASPVFTGTVSATNTRNTNFVFVGTTTSQNSGGDGIMYLETSIGTLTATAFQAYGSPTFLMQGANGSTTFRDASASGLQITTTGDTVGTSSGNFYAGYFGGTGDYLSVGSTTALGVGTGDFAIDGWIFKQGSGNQTIFDCRPSTGTTGAYPYLFYRGASNDLRYFVNGTATVISTNSLTADTEYHVAVQRTGGTLSVYVGGVSWGTVTDNNNYPACPLTIGSNDAAEAWTGRIGALRFTKSSLWGVNNFTPPTLGQTFITSANEYTLKYKDPFNNQTVFKIFTLGTATSMSSYIYCNATTTVFGLGTSTAITGTTTSYSGWFDGAVRATAFNVASTEKIKENIKSIKIKPDLLDAEAEAKENYITTQKSVWISDNINNYTYVGTETWSGGTITTHIDNVAMEKDYANYIELAWASDINQDTYTETIQKNYEKGFWQMFDSVTPRSWNPKDKPSLIRKGFVVEDMPDVVKGDDGQSIDPMALIAYISVVQQTLKADTIFALSTLKELIISGTVTQQKIDYVNDRLEVLNP